MRERVRIRGARAKEGWGEGGLGEVLAAEGAEAVELDVVGTWFLDVYNDPAANRLKEI